MKPDLEVAVDELIPISGDKAAILLGSLIDAAKDDVHDGLWHSIPPQ